MRPPGITGRYLPPTSLVVLLLLVAGSVAVYAAAGRTSAKRSTTTSLTIKGSLRVPLRPGASRKLDLTLANRRAFALRVTRLRVRLSVDRRHRAAGCSARRDFAVRQIPRRA